MVKICQKVPTDKNMLKAMSDYIFGNLSKSSLKKSFFETRINVFYSTSKAFFNIQYWNIQTL